MTGPKGPSNRHAEGEPVVLSRLGLGPRLSGNHRP